MSWKGPVEQSKWELKLGHWQLAPGWLVVAGLDNLVAFEELEELEELEDQGIWVDVVDLEELEELEGLEELEDLEQVDRVENWWCSGYKALAGSGWLGWVEKEERIKVKAGHK